MLAGPESVQAPVGASAALDQRLALTDGLLQHCVQLTVDQLPLAPRPTSIHPQPAS